MNIVWRTKALKKLDFQQLNRNFYDPKAAIQVPTITFKGNGSKKLDRFSNIFLCKTVKLFWPFNFNNIVDEISPDQTIRPGSLARVREHGQAGREPTHALR